MNSLFYPKHCLLLIICYKQLLFSTQTDVGYQTFRIVKPALAPWLLPRTQSNKKANTLPHYVVGPYDMDRSQSVRSSVNAWMTIKPSIVIPTSNRPRNQLKQSLKRQLVQPIQIRKPYFPNFSRSSVYKTSSPPPNVLALSKEKDIDQMINRVHDLVIISIKNGQFNKRNSTSLPLNSQFMSFIPRNNSRREENDTNNPWAELH
nr:uncharacterized protein LOC107448940 [Parasteatoda tepidariorum]